MTRDHDLGCPSPRRDPEKLELDREEARVLLGPSDVRVDAVDVGVDDLDAVVVVVAELLPEVAPELEEARPDVALQLTGPEDFGNRAGRLSPPELELKESIAGGVPALSEEQVVLRLRVDVADAPPVDQDFDGLLEGGDVERDRFLCTSEEGETSDRQDRREESELAEHDACRSRGNEADGSVDPPASPHKPSSLGGRGTAAPVARPCFRREATHSFCRYV